MDVLWSCASADCTISRHGGRPACFRDNGRTSARTSTLKYKNWTSLSPLQQALRRFRIPFPEVAKLTGKADDVLNAHPSNRKLWKPGVARCMSSKSAVERRSRRDASEYYNHSGLLFADKSGKSSSQYKCLLLWSRREFPKSCSPFPRQSRGTGLQ